MGNEPWRNLSAGFIVDSVPITETMKDEETPGAVTGMIVVVG